MRAWVSGECARFPEDGMREFKSWWDRILAGVQRPYSQSASDEEELADEVISFLVELRKTGNDSIETFAGFKTAFSRYIRRHKPSAKSELWGIANEALKQLLKQRRAQLVYRFDQKSNRAHKEDEWASSDLKEAIPKYQHFSPQDFTVLQNIWLKKVSGPRKGASHHAVKLVSPKEAQDFLSAVLDHFKRVMTMEQLLEALVKNNQIFSTQTFTPNETENGEVPVANPILSAPDTGLSERNCEFIRRESNRRGKGLGTQFVEEGLCPLFNGYYMRKKLRQEQVVLDGFNKQTAQRNSEAITEIERMIRSHLPFYESPDEFVPDEIAYDDPANTRSQFFDKIETIWIEVFTRTLEVAESYCSENCHS